MIRVEGLSRRFGRLLAVDNVSFALQPGELVALLGCNGAGKTTTMRMMVGELAPHEGSVFFHQEELDHTKHLLRAKVGYLPERAPLYPEMTVSDFVRFAAKIRRADSSRAHVEEILNQVGLSGMGHRVIGRLSKGYQQRVGLAQALVHDPEILILDEPTSGLDLVQRLEIRDLLRSLSERGKTVVLSTHHLQEVEALCRRVLLLRGGRLVVDEALDVERYLELHIHSPTEQVLEVLKAHAPDISAQGLGRFRCRTPDNREALIQAASGLGLQGVRTLSGLDEQFLVADDSTQEMT